MGLYSTNRIQSVIDSITGEAVNEELDLAGVEPDYGSIIESTIQIHEANLKMFDTLIEADFIEAANNISLGEAAVSINEENDEVKKQGIGAKLKKLITFVIEKIKQAAQALINKIVQLFSSDDKILAKYKQVVKLAAYKPEKLENFPGISNFASPKSMNDSSRVTFEKNFDLKDLINKSTDEVSKKIDEMTAELTSDDYIKNFFNEKQDKWKPTKEEINIILDYMSEGGRNQINDVKVKSKDAINAIKNFTKSVKKNGDEYKDAAEAYQNASKICAFVTKSWNTFRVLRVKQLGASRKAMIILGRYLLGEKKAENKENDNKEVKSTGEAATYFILGEASDAYIESIFGY